MVSLEILKACMEKKCAHEHGKDESDSAEEGWGGIKGIDTCGAWAMHDRLMDDQRRN